MKKIIAFLFTGISTVLALNCKGTADIVIAVPGSYQAVPSSEFQYLENFLTSLVSYYNVSESATQVGLILYGKEPEVIANLGEAVSKKSINARITHLSHRHLFQTSINGGQNVPKAIRKVHDLLKAGRPHVPKIGIIMTYGSKDLTSSISSVVSEHVSDASKSALEDGIKMFAVSTDGTVPGFPNITKNTCRLFSLGKYNGGLSVLLPYLASSTCYVLDASVNPAPGNCFPKIQQPPVVEEFECGPGDSIVADSSNCAYFYQCLLGMPIRQKCAPGTMFDSNIKRCNHKEFVTCYSSLHCPSPWGLFSHPSDCNQFLSCSQNIPYVQKCPEGLVFNPRRRYCDYEHNVPECR